MITTIRFADKYRTTAMTICKKALIKEGYTVADYPDHLLVIEKPDTAAPKQKTKVELSSILVDVRKMEAIMACMLKSYNEKGEK